MEGSYSFATDSHVKLSRAGNGRRVSRLYVQGFLNFGTGMDIVKTMKRLEDEIDESAELLISNNPWGLEFRIRAYIDDKAHCRSFMVSYDAIEKANFDILELEMDEAIRTIRYAML